MSYTDPNDLIMGGGGVPAAKFPNVGDKIVGTIKSIEQVQAREYAGAGQIGPPKTWPSGDPMMIAVLTLATDLRDPAIDDDDGTRRLYLDKRHLREAVKGAVLAAGASRVLPGGKVAVAYTGDDPQSKNPANPAKMFTAQYKAPEAGLSVDMFGGGQAQPAVAPAADPFTTAPVPQPAPQPATTTAW